MEYLNYIFFIWIIVSVGQILNPLYFCCKEQLPLLLYFILITSSPFLKVRNNPVLTGAASHLRSFIGIWAKPGWFQEVSRIKLPAMLSWNLFKALVTGRILLSLVPMLLKTGLRPEFERRQLWNKNKLIVLILWQKFNPSGIFSEAFSCSCVRNGFTKHLARKSQSKYSGE